MTEEPLIRLFPTAADYIVLDREPRGAVKHIVFIEEEDGKGLTLVPTADGNILAGPTDRDATEEEVRSRDMRVSREGLEEIRRKCIEAVPELDIDSQIRTFGSLRPNPFSVREEQGRIIRSSKSIKDIQLFSEDGLFSLIGIKTPGLTIADELGRLTTERVTEYLGCSTLRENFDPRRKGITRISDLTYSERAELAATDSACSEIVCSCMDVTRREILEAYERGARSVEAIKRRTGAGMGRCQGSRCRKKILGILASCDSQKVIQ